MEYKLGGGSGVDSRTNIGEFVEADRYALFVPEVDPRSCYLDALFEKEVREVVDEVVLLPVCRWTDGRPPE